MHEYFETEMQQLFDSNVTFFFSNLSFAVFGINRVGIRSAVSGNAIGGGYSSYLSYLSRIFKPL